VLHYVEDEAADRVMPEAEAVVSLEQLGFRDVKIVYRRHMDAVLIARKPGETDASPGNRVNSQDL
jgi:hypothetical protein